MQIALKISDDLIRNAALRKADDLRRAEVLFRGIQSAAIGEAALLDNPSLRK
jgi:hypothetical protein